MNIDPLETQIRECYGRVVYSHKAHEKAADIYLSRLWWLGVTQIALSAITTTGVLVSLFGDGTTAKITAAMSSTILLGIHLYTKESNLGTLAQKHADTANDLWDIRERYLSLLTDLIENGDKSRIQSERDKIQKNLKSIYSGAPRSIPKAYSLAQKSLKVNEELTFSTEEIDQFLPDTHRRSSK